MREHVLHQLYKKAHERLIATIRGNRIQNANTMSSEGQFGTNSCGIMALSVEQWQAKSHQPTVDDTHPTERGTYVDIVIHWNKNGHWTGFTNSLYATEKVGKSMQHSRRNNPGYQVLMHFLITVVTLNR